VITATLAIYLVGLVVVFGVRTCWATTVIGASGPGSATGSPTHDDG
jgi:hypothetical protein